MMCEKEFERVCCSDFVSSHSAPRRHMYGVGVGMLMRVLDYV